MKDISVKFANAHNPVIKPRDARKINYNSKSFLRGLYKIKKEIEKSQENSIPDYQKRYLSFNN